MRVLLGSRTLALDDRWGSWVSTAMFCPMCGDVWGRIHASEKWKPLSAHCEKHSLSYRTGGSFFQDWLPQFNLGLKSWDSGTNFPVPQGFLILHPELLKHEFRVALAWADKFSTAGSPAFQQELV